jgi:hypothetical protein
MLEDSLLGLHIVLRSNLKVLQAELLFFGRALLEFLGSLADTFSVFGPVFFVVSSYSVGH